MSLTSDEANEINEMNVAAGDAELGTEVLANQTSIATLEADSLFAVAGEYTMVSGDDSAGTKAIDTGKSISGWMVQIFRAGVMVMDDAIISAATTVLTITDGAANYVLTADDIVHYIVW